MCKRVVNLLEVIYLRLWKIVVDRVTVVKFGMDKRGSICSGCFGIRESELEKPQSPKSDAQTLLQM